MELREGYKQTEMGIIPEDWEVKSYGEVFDFLTTATYSRAELTKSDKVSYIHYGDIHTKWHFFLDVEKNILPTISDEQVKSYHLIMNGDIVMADASEDYSGIGKSIEIRNLGDKKAISGLHTFLLRDKRKIIADGYKGYLHSISSVKSQFDKLATGLKVYGVSKNNLKTVQIPLPPTKAEQTAIATALSDADALVAGLEKLIAKKRNIKQGAMQKLLTPKEGWEVKKLGEECKLVTKGTTPTSIGKDFCSTGINFIKVESLNANGNFRNEFFAYIDEETHAILKRSQLKENDLLISIAGALGRTCIVRKEVLPANTNQALAIVRLKQDSDFVLCYLFYFLRTEKVSKHIDAISVQGAQPNLSLLNIFELPIFIPPTKIEQTHIANILSDMAAEIATLETKLEKYKMIKQGMMQNLLTGKIRMVDTAQIKKENKAEVIPFIPKKGIEQSKGHNWQINEAVVISVLTKQFGSEKYPLGRKRYTKLSYLLHRHIEHKAEGYLKKVAGPYNPDTKYKGPEKIAKDNKYIQQVERNKYSGFVVAENIAKAERYFEKWYGWEAIEWLEQFRYQNNDTLELCTTVDLAIQDIKKEGKTVSLETVVVYIKNIKEWKAKLKRSIFSDENIEGAIDKLQNLFNGH